MAAISAGMLRFATLIVAVLAASRVSPAIYAQVTSGSEPQQVFRAGVNYVDVDAVVTDRSGALVRNLTKDDFEIFEDGIRQQVDVFSFVDIPLPPAAAALSPVPTVERDTVSNTTQAGARIYMIVLDDLQTDAARSLRVRAIVQQFVQRHLGPDDVAAIVHTSGRIDGAQPFTGNRRLLVEAADKFVGRKLRSATLERLDDVRMSNPNLPDPDPRLARTADPMEAERSYRARSTLDSLRKASELMAAARGRRKALIYVSEGIDYDTQGIVAQTASKLSFFTADSGSVVRNAIRDAVAAAIRGSVRIYAFDPRGLPGSGDDLIQVQGRFPENPQTGVTPEAFQEEVRTARDTLRVLADETGGFAALTSNDVTGVFDRIVRDNSSYYVLGYHSSDTRLDGRYRQIAVRTRRPGLQVRARAGYAAPREIPAAIVPQDATAPPRLLETIASPTPVTGLSLRLFATPFRADGGRASVLVGVEVDASGFRFVQSDGRFTDALTLSVLAFDVQGLVRTSDSNEVKLSLTPDTHRAVMRNGLRAFFRLDLPTGRYQLRVAGLESGASLTGSVNYDLELGDFAREALTMSGVVVTSDRAAAVPTVAPDPATSGLPAPPSAERRLAVGDALVCFVEVYGTVRTAYLDAEASVIDSRGRVVVRQNERLALAAGDRSGLYQIAATLPTADLAAGDYILRVMATDDTGDRAAREVPITIVSAPNR